MKKFQKKLNKKLRKNSSFVLANADENSTSTNTTLVRYVESHEINNAVWLKLKINKLKKIYVYHFLI